MRPLLACVVDAALQADRVVRVAVLRRDVKVAHQHQARVRGQLGAQPVVQGGEPAQFVGKFFAARLLPVDKIAIDHAQRALRRV